MNISLTTVVWLLLQLQWTGLEEVCITCLFSQITVSNNFCILKAIASLDASMVASSWTHNTCYSLCIVLVNDPFACHVFIFDYALQVVLYGK